VQLQQRHQPYLELYLQHPNLQHFQLNLLFVEQNFSEDLQIAEDEPKVEQVSPNDIHRLISELPDGYRTVLNLYVFEGFSHRQIAKLLGIKEGTSASQLYYAKQLLAKKIRELTKDK
jgi:RNA polymerase sigma-70 factor (ECF subfamily)